MARMLEKSLYKELMSSNFSFIPKGTHHIDNIYDFVIMEYPDLCDSNYLCLENCTAGNNQPEWKHTVRNVLQRLKKSTGRIKFTGRRGYWELG